MSELSGNLADFELPAVIRLLASGSKTGILVIQAVSIDGSIFFDGGALTYATTRKNTGISSPKAEERRDEESSQPEAMIADVVTRLTRQGGGSFMFQAGVHPVHTVDSSFQASQILEMVELQLELWKDIDQALGSTEQPYVMVRNLPSDDKIELTGQHWNVLAALAYGQSVTGLANHMRLPELTTAEIVVQLRTDGLIELAETAPEVPPARTGSDGGSLEEPTDAEIVLSLTNPSDSADGGDTEMEAPASDLAARWRDLRAGQRDEASQSQ